MIDINEIKEVSTLKDIVRSVVSLSIPDHYFMSGEAVEMKPASGAPGAHTMVVNPDKTYQSILGLGGIWTDTDVYALLRMSPEKQEEALTAIFDKEKGMGWSLMRVPFGSTDWEVTPDFYTYDDMPRGEKDWNLEHFSIQRDIDRGLFDVLRRCKEINPEVTFFASVWGMPAWMKENDSIMYGRFDPACTDVYARYLAKTVQAYKEQGIDLYAVTPQNESLTGNDRATPATRMTWWVQRDLVLAMRREFDALGLTDTGIWIYDHNFDMSDYFVKPMLEDEALRKAIDGVAFHDYGGDPYVMGELFEKYPDVNFYMTERTITTVRDMDTLVRELRNGARSYAQWTTMSDEYGGPHSYMGTPFVYGGFKQPSPMERRNHLYNLRNDPHALFRAPSFGIYGTFSKFLQPGMVRVESTYGAKDWLTGVAFKDPKDGHIAMIVVNQTESAQPLTIRCGSGSADFEQPAKSITAYVFTPDEICAAEPCPVVELPVVKAPAWDIAMEDIHLNGPAKAEADLLLSAIVRNVGDIPTPENATIRVEFNVDGDNLVACSNVCLPVLQPGECFEAVSNRPFGMPYVYRVAWHAEQGRHQIFARAVVGNADAEKWLHNNIWAKEFYFE